MERKITFRAWDKVEKRWLNATEVYIEANHGDVVRVRFPEETKMINDSSTEVSQFTGLLDKNGKEIYEGDVVEHYDGIGLVEMKNGSWCLTYDSNPKDQAFGKPDLLVDMLANLHTDDQTPSAEIIGNIYESPTLLSS